ncbi:MAG: hypothetical protein JSS31_14910 [Proteobacteria bacterium]|nr:hypothetical protein [Pseudomonadota bacterium]
MIEHNSTAAALFAVLAKSQEPRCPLMPCTDNWACLKAQLPATVQALELI